MSGGDWKELYTSAQNGNFEIVKYHLSMGVDPNFQHPEFMTTPLIVAIEKQQFEIAEYLLQNGADPTIKEDWGSNTPLSTAITTKNQKLIALVKTYLQKQKA